MYLENSVRIIGFVIVLVQLNYIKTSGFMLYFSQLILNFQDA